MTLADIVDKHLVSNRVALEEAYAILPGAIQNFLDKVAEYLR